MSEANVRAKEVLADRFGKDTLLSLATTDEGRPYVRIVNSYYEDGYFYTVTYALSKKMKQIAQNPEVAVCGEWFTARGTGENLGWVRDEKNGGMMTKLRDIFAAWYDNGHTNEEDQNTCLLRIKLTEGEVWTTGECCPFDFI